MAVRTPKMTRDEIAAEYPKACSQVDALRKAIADAEALGGHSSLLDGLHGQLKTAIARKVDIFYEHTEWKMRDIEIVQAKAAT